MRNGPLRRVSGPSLRGSQRRNAIHDLSGIEPTAGGAASFMLRSVTVDNRLGSAARYQSVHTIPGCSPRRMVRGISGVQWHAVGLPSLNGPCRVAGAGGELGDTDDRSHDR